MAIVANRHVTVAGAHPRIKMLLHDVAIDTGVGVIAEIAGPFSVAEGERTQPPENAQHDGQYAREQAAPR